MATGPNPFDEYEDLNAATPGEDTLRPGPAPSLLESLDTNYLQPFKTGLLGSLALRADKTTVNKADRGEIAGPGSSPFDGKVSQAGADAARQRLAQAKRDKEAYDAFESPTIAGKAAGLISGLAGMAVQPENFLTAGGVVAGGFARAFGATTAARIGGAAVEAGAVNAAIDVPTQALQIGAGLEDHYSPAQTAAAFGVGAVLGGGMAGLSEVVTRRIAAREAAEAPPAVAPVADAPALATTAEDATATLQAAHAAKGVDDETLAKVAEGAALAGRSDDGSVQVPLSLDEGSALARAGAPVDDAGNMASPAADAVVREAETRAVEGEAALTSEAQATTEAAAPAVEPEPVTVGAPRLAASGLDAADAVKKQWRAEATYDDAQAMLKAAPANQQALGDVGREIAEELGVKFKDPGVKALDADALAALDDAGRAKKQKGVERFLDKVGTKKPGTVTDLVRAGFDLTSPDQGEAILAKLAEKFEVIDEGWVRTPVGYFDRKVYVRFADGMIGELQMWEPSLLQRKNGGGHALYEEARKLKPGDPRLVELNEKMVSLYQDAFDGLSPDWRAAIDGTGGASGNLAANTSADSTRALTPTSAELAGSQALPPSGRTNASPGDQRAGSPSRDANTNSAITGTSGETVAGDTVLDKASNDPLADLERALAGAVDQGAPVLATPEPAAKPKRKAKTKTAATGDEIKVLSAIEEAQRDGFSADISAVRDATGLADADLKRAMLSLQRKGLATLSQLSDPKDARVRDRTGIEVSADDWRELISINADGRASLRQAGAAPAAQPLKKNATASTRDDPDTRFNRRQLDGEDAKPRDLPADATPAEVARFRVSDAMRSITERMGRKLELDGRFTARGALGEYKPGEGVLRIRAEGDVEVFSHELGHALDQELSALPSWQAFTKSFERELKALDANDPLNPTTAEGIAEFLRGYITNPAFAKRQNPAMTDVFEKLIARDRPDLAAIVRDATRLSQIDSGMEPADVLRTMITTAIEPTGLAKFNDERKRIGLLPTLNLWFDRAYAGMFGKDHWVRRFTDELRGAHFQSTGRPMPEFTESGGMGFRNPYQAYRMLVGAKQAAVDGLYYGPKAYGGALGGRVAPGVYDALAKAFNGHVTAIDNPNDPLVRSFSAYLVARRAKALYGRWENGELRNPPIRASKNEVEAGLITLEKENPQFKEAADDIIAFSNAMWQKKFDAGIISREINDIVSNRNDDYVPFYRDFRDEKAGSGGKGGSSLQRNGVKTMKGSSRDILDPVHSIIFDAMQTERIIALNDTMKFMHRLAQTGGEFSGRFLERVPNSEMIAQSFDLAEGMRNAARSAGLDKADAEVMIRHIEDMIGDDMSATVFKATETTPKGERIMFYWEGGERVALKVGDNEASRQFFDLLSGQTAAERDVMLALIGKANGLFSQLITNAPQFALKNIIMDNVSRIFISRNTGALGRVPGAAIAAGVYTQIFDKEFARAYAAVGGIRGGIVSAATRELDEARGIKGIGLRPKDLTAMAQEAMALLGNPKDLAIAVVKSPLHALEAVIRGIESTETMGRLGQAKIVNNHLRKQGLTPEEAFHAASFEARDVLDYDRKGWAVGSASRILPFLNAGFQGLDRSQRNLFGGPVKAAIEAYNRGGYANLDGEAKSALKDAVMNWGLIAGGVATTMSYYAMNSDDPVYQRMSDYMKRRYYVFPGGQRADGTQMVVTVPKPFDHAGGIFSAVEAFMDGIRRQDPEMWHKVVKNLQEGFIPRQLGGLQEFMSSLPPTLKVPFEVLTGTKLGFDGGPSFPIVPANLKALPPEMQYTGTTGYVSKKLGEWFGVSPVVAEHVMTGLGGTTARDASTLATAIFDDQPNVTVSDAMTRTFFGALYRGQTGGGSFKSDLMQVMSRDNGQYAVLAKGYSQAIEEGDTDQAASIYGRGSDIAKTIMTIRAGKFKPEERQVHPLERTVALGDILSKITRDLSTAQVEKLDRSRKKGAERDYIDLQPTTARALTGTIGYLMAEEIRNGLAIVGQGGYEAYPVIDTAARYEAIRALSPEVADELQKRIKKAHILPAATVASSWPELKRRLLLDRDQAKIRDLKRPQ